ncbi:MAG TPA: hypothetical protein VGG72_03915 [Bryobacteraceae bacterium]|jgi:hypothetical protein
MFQLAVTVIIAAGSVLLFAYWFRYTCLLIVSAKTALDYAGGVATANQLNFLNVQSSLHERNFTDLDPLRAALERDYSVITYLLKNAAHSSAEESSIETKMLAMNYRLMGAWYQVSRRFSTEVACKALEDMSQVVAHFANVMGERNAAMSPSAA